MTAFFNRNLVIFTGLAWLVWLALVLLLSLVDGIHFQYDLLRFILLAALTVLGSASVLFVRPGYWQHSGIGWAVGWAAVLIISSVLMPNQRHTWLELYQNSLFCLAFIGLGGLLAQRRWIPFVLQGFIHALPVVAFIYAVGCLYTYGFALLDQQSRLATFLPWGFINIRYWSQVASWIVPLLPLSLLLSPLQQNGRWRFLVYATLAIWVWVLILSSARGSLLALLLSISICWLLFQSMAKSWALILIKGTLLGVTTWLILSVGVHAGLFGLADSIGEIRVSGSGRLPLYIEALAMSWQNFPLGMGPFSWLTHTPLTEIYTRSQLFGHPHNMMLLWAAEYGWLAVAMLAGLAWHALLRVRRWLAKTTASVELIALTASVLAACIHSNFSAVFITPYSLMIGLGVLSLFWGVLHQDLDSAAQALPTAKAQPKRPNSMKKLLALLLLLAGMANLFYNYHYYQHNRAMVEQQPNAVSGLSTPRYFQYSILIKK